MLRSVSRNPDASASGFGHPGLRSHTGGVEILSVGVYLKNVDIGELDIHISEKTSAGSALVFRLAPHPTYTGEISFEEAPPSIDLWQIPSDAREITLRRH